MSKLVVNSLYQMVKVPRGKGTRGEMEFVLVDDQGRERFRTTHLVTTGKGVPSPGSTDTPLVSPKPS